MDTLLKPKVSLELKTEEELNEIKKFLGIEDPERKKRNEIKSLKARVASTDYQIIKCYEYSLAGLELPYDIQTLHSEREAIREQIREIENTN